MALPTVFERTQWEETDFTDDRLTILLRKLSHGETWSQIEGALNHNTISIYDLRREQIRLDATTMSGHHLVSESGLFQFGHSKDDPNLAQIKVMLASLDLLGMPLATTVVSGEQADDGLLFGILKVNYRGLLLLVLAINILPELNLVPMVK